MLHTIFSTPHNVFSLMQVITESQGLDTDQNPRGAKIRPSSNQAYHFFSEESLVSLDTLANMNFL